MAFDSAAVSLLWVTVYPCGSWTRKPEEVVQKAIFSVLFSALGKNVLWLCMDVF